MQRDLRLSSYNFYRHQCFLISAMCYLYFGTNSLIFNNRYSMAEKSAEVRKCSNFVRKMFRGL